MARAVHLSRLAREGSALAPQDDGEKLSSAAGRLCRELEEILQYISEKYPGAYSSFENRLHAIIRRVATWPESAPEVIERPGIRRVPFIRYPYKMSYRILPDRIETLHLHHSTRDESFEL